jgi:hypothetical protein
MKWDFCHLPFGTNVYDGNHAWKHPTFKFLQQMRELIGGVVNSFFFVTLSDIYWGKYGLNPQQLFSFFGWK